MTAATRAFSTFRVAAAIQVAPVGAAVWFMFKSRRMSCAESGAFGFFTLEVLTLTSGLLLAAILFERRWKLIGIPFLWWFVVGILFVPHFIH